MKTSKTKDNLRLRRIAVGLRKQVIRTGHVASEYQLIPRETETCFYDTGHFALEEESADIATEIKAFISDEGQSNLASFQEAWHQRN